MIYHTTYSRGDARGYVVSGKGKCWHPIDFQYGEDDFTDATAATYGLTVDSPLVPDALDNPRKHGKVAYGPINYAVPTILSAR